MTCAILCMVNVEKEILTLSKQAELSGKASGAQCVLVLWEPSPSVPQKLWDCPEVSEQQAKRQNKSEKHAGRRAERHVDGLVGEEVGKVFSNEPQRLLFQVLIKQEIQRKSGYAIQADEEQLRVQLDTIQCELNAPTQFKVSS